MQEQGHVRKSDLHYTGVIDCIKKLLKKAGIPGFYRGCATNLMRTTPSAVITFTSYEMIHRFLLRVSSPEEKHAELHPKPNENDSIKSNQGTTPLHQSVSPSPDDRTHLIPLGNTDKLTWVLGYFSFFLLNFSLTPKFFRPNKRTSELYIFFFSSPLFLSHALAAAVGIHLFIYFCDFVLLILFWKA